MWLHVITSFWAYPDFKYGNKFSASLFGVPLQYQSMYGHKHDNGSLRKRKYKSEYIVRNKFKFPHIIMQRWFEI